MFRTMLMVPMLLGALTFTGGAHHGPEPEPDLAGMYVGSGVNADGSQYRVIVEIARQNGAFLLVWSSESEIVAVGIGVLSGNVLAVAYFAEPPGVVAYRIEEANRLVGEWTVVGAEGTLFSETLTKVPADHHPTLALPSQPKPPRAGPGHRST